MHIHTVRPGDVDAATADQLAGVVNRQFEIEAPHMPPETGETILGELLHGWDGEAADRLLVARDDDGELLGYAEIELPMRENRTIVWFRIEVEPRMHRQGIGGALYAEAEKVSAEVGRDLLMTCAWHDSAGARFLRNRGFTLGSVEAQRRLYPTLLPREGDAELLEQARAMSADYEVVRVQGPLPDELLESMLETVATINDAPTDDLEVEDDVWSVERMRDYDAAMAAQRQRMYRVIARTRADGSPAGQSVVAVDARRPFFGDQHDTTVRRQHRGHRLGLRLKLEMLQWLRETEPQLEYIDTWNAESNAHMIAVNDAIGCSVVGRMADFQKHR